MQSAELGASARGGRFPDHGGPFTVLRWLVVDEK